jgi:hypothetical protein
LNVIALTAVALASAPTDGEAGDCVGALGEKIVIGDGVGGGGSGPNATVGKTRAGGTLAGGATGGTFAGTACGIATQVAGGTYTCSDCFGGGPHVGIFGTGFGAAFRRSSSGGPFASWTDFFAGPGIVDVATGGELRAKATEVCGTEGERAAE